MCNEPFCFYSGLRRHLDTDYKSYSGPWTHFDADGNTTNVCPLDDSERQVTMKNKWRDQRVGYI